MAAGDEPSNAELARNITQLTRSIEVLSGKVLTVDVWSAERVTIDLRIAGVSERTSANDAAVKAESAERKAERAADQIKRDAEATKVQAFRRQIIFAISTAVLAPIFVAVVTVLILKGGFG